MNSHCMLWGRHSTCARAHLSFQIELYAASGDFNIALPLPGGMELGAAAEKRRRQTCFSSGASNGGGEGECGGCTGTARGGVGKSFRARRPWNSEQNNNNNLSSAPPAPKGFAGPR